MCEQVAMDIPNSPTEFAASAGISVPYASEILSGKRTPSTRLAIDIFKRTGRRFGSVVSASDDDIAALDRLTPRRAAESAAA
jgi:transcriptional regulator with XRE-family HTH domain